MNIDKQKAQLFRMGYDCLATGRNPPEEFVQQWKDWQKAEVGKGMAEAMADYQEVYDNRKIAMVYAGCLYRQ